MLHNTARRPAKVLSILFHFDVTIALSHSCLQLQEAREEVSLLRARNSRLTAAAEGWQAERSYLLAERKLQVAQLRGLAVLLAADAGG